MQTIADQVSVGVISQTEHRIRHTMTSRVLLKISPARWRGNAGNDMRCDRIAHLETNHLELNKARFNAPAKLADPFAENGLANQAA